MKKKYPYYSSWQTIRLHLVKDEGVICLIVKRRSYFDVCDDEIIPSITQSPYDLISTWPMKSSVQPMQDRCQHEAPENT